MKSDRLNWCARQKKGLKIVEPSENLSTVYFQKAESALNMLNSAIEKKEIDWIVTTSYYARYFAFYALLAKCGIKCEIHDCTILAMKTLFTDENLLNLALYSEIEESKSLRTDLQYYAYKEFDKNKVMNLAKTAPDFVLKIKEAIESFGEKEISQVRKKLANSIH
jgi:uncharacterized protein (UPF0332 family)